MTKALPPPSYELAYTILGIVLAFCFLDYGISRYCYEEVIWGETTLLQVNPVNIPYWKHSKNRQKHDAVMVYEALRDWEKRNGKPWNMPEQKQQQGR
jgi:hypothetical protein